jgi:hypothetical protein
MQTPLQGFAGKNTSQKLKFTGRTLPKRGIRPFRRYAKYAHTAEKYTKLMKLYERKGYGKE